jgi:hypothetical protein
LTEPSIGSNQMILTIKSSSGKRKNGVKFQQIMGESDANQT